MSNLQAKSRRINPSTAFLTFGLLLTLFAVMFRPGGAEAVLPTEALVFPKYDATTGATVKYSDLQKITADYDVILTGKKSASRIALTGIPLVDFLKANNVDTNGVGFVKIRIGTTDDSAPALVPLNPEATTGRPPMILDSGNKPGVGPFKTPAIVVGQPTDKPITEGQIVPFDRKTQELTIIPSQPGAKIMSVRVSSKKTSKGEYKLTAKATAGTSGGALKYEWFAGDKDGTASVVSNKSTYTTTDATSGTKQRSVNIVVTEVSTGSTGANSFQYVSKKANDGKTTPFPKTPGTTTPGTGTTPGTIPGTGTGGNGTPGGGVFTPSPGSTPIPSTPTPPTTPTTPPTPTTTPTGPTSTPDVPSTTTAADTSGIANIAQNVSGNGKVQTVSGVLLSAPNVPKTTSSVAGGAPITALPAPVATELNSIFPPINQPNDFWPYFLTVLFGLVFIGAVREWVNP